MAIRIEIRGIEVTLDSLADLAALKAKSSGDVSTHVRRSRADGPKAQAVDYFKRHPTAALAPEDLAKELDVYASKARTILTGLVDQGLLERTPISGKFTLPKIVAIPSPAARREPPTS